MYLVRSDLTMAKYFKILLCVLALGLTPSMSFASDSETDSEGNDGVSSFETAKKYLRDDVYPENQTTVYCGCPYNKIEIKRDYESEKQAAIEKHLLYNWDSMEGFTFPTYEEWSKQPKRYTLEPDLKACGYEPKGSGVRARRVEWEHAFPASHLGKEIAAWHEGHDSCVTSYREVRVCERLSSGKIECTTKVYEPKAYKGRSCASKVSPQFRRMESDLHNLYPSVGEANGYRSNLPYGIVPGEPREFGKCDFEIANGVAEPTEAVRGELARTYFYLQNAYPSFVSIDPSMIKMLRSWDNSDPVDEWECKRNQLIKSIQGNSNPFVDEACINAGIFSSEDQDL